MRIVLTGGKTGGHVYPAIAVAEALTTAGVDRADFLYLGMQDGVEERVLPETGMRGYFFHLTTPTGVAVPLALARLAWATAQAMATLLRFRPNVMLSTGGFVSIPATFAGWALRVPIVIFLPDALPGRTVHAASRLARVVALSMPCAVSHFRRTRVVVTGYPVRSAFNSVCREEGRRRFQIPAQERVLLVMGGSQGSRAINRVIAKHIAELLEVAVVIHVAGAPSMEEMLAAWKLLPPSLSARYHVFPFLDGETMAAAMAAADLAIARSGASVLGELTLAALPSILVPLASVRVHQEANAAALVERGAAVCIDDSSASERLVPTALDLLEDAARRTQMALAARALARPRAAECIAEVLTEAAMPFRGPKFLC